MSLFFNFPGAGYYAFKTQNMTAEESWAIVPIDYWMNNRHLKDGHANVEINGMEEVMDHVYQKTQIAKSLDAAALLTQAGFTIIDNPFITHKAE